MGVIAAGVRWFGRVDTTSDAAHPRFSWSGTGFIAKFMGTSLTAQLTTTGTTRSFKPVIDGTPQAGVHGRAGVDRLVPARHRAWHRGVHTVELYRQTEGPQGKRSSRA